MVRCTDDQLNGIQPIESWRYYFQFLTRIICRIGMFVLGFYWIPVKGKITVSNHDVPIVVCNHQSWFDSIYLTYYLGCSFVAKSELRRMPFFGNIITCFQGIYVDRRSLDSRQQVLNKVTERVTSHSGRFLTIYPEGTRYYYIYIMRFFINRKIVQMVNC